jgi:hypothetical protein
MNAIFRLGVWSDNFWRGKSVGPTHWNLTKEQIEASNYVQLKKNPIPAGWTGTYPYIVKVGTTGEYIVNADGTAQFLDYVKGSVSEPFYIT